MGVERVVAWRDGDANDLSGRKRVAEVEVALVDSRPDALAIAGYADLGMLAAARWGTRHRLTLVLISDSQYHDEPRVWWKEAVKRQVVGCFGAALVAGTTRVSYLRGLGMLVEQIFTGCDVVDNEDFAIGADAARAHSARWRNAFGPLAQRIRPAGATHSARWRATS